MRRNCITRNKTKREGMIFVLPAICLLILVVVSPLGQTIYLSIVTETGVRLTTQHYRRAIGDPLVGQALANTFLIACLSVVGFHILGLPIALFVNKPTPARKILRLLVLLPWTLPDVAVALTWRWLYDPTYGPLNELLRKLGISGMNWLTDPQAAIFSVIAANVWRGFPFVTLILLAGLQSIPKELYECAALDGAGNWRRFLHITLPCLRKPFIVSLAITLVWEFRRFALVQVMTGGGPGYATEIAPTLIFKRYFAYFQFNYASAIAVIFTLLLLCLSIPYVRAISRSD